MGIWILRTGSDRGCRIFPPCQFFLWTKRIWFIKNGPSTWIWRHYYQWYCVVYNCHLDVQNFNSQSTSPLASNGSKPNLFKKNALFSWTIIVRSILIQQCLNMRSNLRFPVTTLPHYKFLFSLITSKTIRGFVTVFLWFLLVYLILQTLEVYLPFPF